MYVCTYVCVYVCVCAFVCACAARAHVCVFLTHTHTRARTQLVFDNSDGRMTMDGDEVVLRRTIGLKKDEVCVHIAPWINPNTHT